MHDSSVFFLPISWRIAKNIIDPLQILIFHGTAILYFLVAYAFYLRMKFNFVLLLWIARSIVLRVVGAFFIFNDIPCAVGQRSFSLWMHIRFGIFNSFYRITNFKEKHR